MPTAEELAEVLKVLANPVRLKILALCLFEERSSRELREMLGISKPLLINHIKKLVNAKLLDVRVAFDEERMVVIKYYKTNEFKVVVDGKVLEEILINSLR